MISDVIIPTYDSLSLVPSQRLGMPSRGSASSLTMTYSTILEIGATTGGLPLQNAI
jgi:hypothetical protein